jgi:hypothetical protein
MLAEKRVELKKLEVRSVEIKALEEVEKVIRSVEIDDIDSESLVVPAGMKEKPVIVVEHSVRGKSESKALGGDQLEDQLKAEKIFEKKDDIAVKKAISDLIQIDLEKETIEDPPKERAPAEAPAGQIKEVLSEVTLSVKPTPPVQTASLTVEPTPAAQEASPVETTTVPPLQERKPVRIAEIKGIREKEDDDFEEEDEMWFERAVQEE